MEQSDQPNNRSIRVILDKYIEERVQKPDTQFRENVAFYSCFLLYLALMGVLAIPSIPTVVKGIVAQFEVLISVYMALCFSHKGFWGAVILNSVNIFLVVFSLVMLNNTNAATGIVVNIFTIISVLIITTLVTRNARHFQEVMRQKEELLALNEEVISSEEELRRQNKELFDSYQIIKKDEEKLNFLAYFDTLTELPNRKMVLDRLGLLVNLSRQNNLSFSVVFIDLDDFKKINDSMGHMVGDDLIVAVARRLRRLVHPTDILGRLGGDEFALIIQQDLKDEAILTYVESLRSSLEEKFKISQHELFIKASFGISKYPQDGIDPNELIRCADTAMYKAKETGKNGVYFFHRDMLEEILQKLDFEKKMTSALEFGEFYLAYQPQFLANDKTLRGFEALIRWNSPDFGLMSPMKFIPITEETRFIVPLGEWILSTACGHMKELMDRYNLPGAILSVNISAIQFDDPGFIDMLKNILETSAFPANNLELEITESVMIKSLDRTKQILTELKSLGVKIALDDFGTGYSSLRYLQILPIDTLKIDKSFVDNINESNLNKQIIGAIISLVHKMNIIVVAEGVESATQLNYLCQENCDGIQGFLLGKPQTITDLTGFLDENCEHLPESAELDFTTIRLSEDARVD